MSLAETPEQISLEVAVRHLLADKWSTDALREALSGDICLPALWATVEQRLGVLSLLVPDSMGGGGGCAADAVVAFESSGRALAPGPLPFAATVLKALADGGHANLVQTALAESWLFTVALDPSEVSVDAQGRMSGRLQAVPGVLQATHALVPLEGRCVVVAVPPDASELDVQVDPSRGMGSVTLHSADATPVDVSWTGAKSLLLLLLAAESVGAAAWCLDAAVSHAKSREQFGRPIGQFQAVKHRCADVLVGIERAASAVWEAARREASDEEFDLAVAMCADLASRAHVLASQACIQILGGMGFTWEHDVHLYARRALHDRTILDFCGGDPQWVGRQVLAGRDCAIATQATVDDGSVARARELVAPVVQAVADGQESRRAIAQAGLAVPAWPAPWGSGAGPAVAAAVDVELGRSGLARPNLRSARWVLPAVIHHGTASQQDRWVRPALEDGVLWCQMFSEPGAGSDVAALSCRADPLEGGWAITGQKTWVSDADVARWGMCLVRTSSEGKRHAGVSCVVVDLQAPGVEILPIKDLLGNVHFFEVFLDKVRVPADHLIGEVDGGWAVARTMMQSERDFMGDDWSFGEGVRSVRPVMGDTDGAATRQLGELAADEHAIRCLTARGRARLQRGDASTSEVSIRKLLAAQHGQAVASLGHQLSVASGAGAAEVARWAAAVLDTQGLTIGGGTSDMQRNEIGQRILGLPRDA
jgi:alkylation response protein AidB-like acyl-CoA dehydrogenase